MQHYLRFNTGATRKITLPSEYYITKYLHAIVAAFVAYDVIEEQVRTGDVYVISYTELQNHMNTLLATSGLMLLFKRFGMSTTLSSGPGSPPGGGPDGGPSDGPPSGLPPYGGPSPSGGPHPPPPGGPSSSGGIPPPGGPSTPGGIPPPPPRSSSYWSC